MTAAIAATAAILDVFRNAPVGDPFPPEVRAELDRRAADIAAGRVELVPHDAVPAYLAELARRDGHAVDP